MRVLLWFLSLFVVLIEAATSPNTTCSDVCTFLQNDSNWQSFFDDNDGFDIGVNSTTVTGIVTAEFKTFYDFMNDCSINKFQFVSSLTDNSNIPLEFGFYPKTKVSVIGKQSGQKTEGKDIRFKNQMGNYFQISDGSQNQYSIIMGDASSTESGEDDSIGIEYNYESDSKWAEFQNNNIRLRDTVRVKNEGKCVVFKYISVCPDATPRLCEESFSVAEAQLGETYNLTCTAAGAPFLYTSWIHDGKNMTNSQETHEVHEATHKITSQIKIQNFTIDDIGNWTCTIYNKNFGSNVTKTIKYSYSSDITIVQAPLYNYYTPRIGQTTTFEWTVKGWPLDQVKLDCGVETYNVTEDNKGYRSNGPPFPKFTLTLRDEKKASCTLYDGERILDTKNITKEGYGCVIGQRGQGKNCETCPIGETSYPESLECFPAQSQCKEGTYGGEDDCKTCPWGTTSPNNTVKIQECAAVESTCGEGEYGTVRCQPCPHGSDSAPRSVKVQDCVYRDSLCQEGFFGLGNDCSPCPSGEKSSYNHAVKIQDCYLRSAGKLNVLLIAVPAAVCMLVVVGMVILFVLIRLRSTGAGRRGQETCQIRSKSPGSHCVAAGDRNSTNHELAAVRAIDQENGAQGSGGNRIDNSNEADACGTIEKEKNKS